MVIALVLVAATAWGRGSLQQGVANLSLLYAAILLFWNWRLDVAERKPRPH